MEMNDFFFFFLERDFEEGVEGVDEGAWWIL